MCCALKQKFVTLYISLFLYLSSICVLLLLVVWFVGIPSVAAVLAAAIGRCSRPRSGRSGSAAGASSSATAAAASATTARPHSATQRPISAHRFPISPFAQFRAIYRKFRCCSS